MKNIRFVILLIPLIFSGISVSLAQDDPPSRKELIDNALDPDSFGKNVRFLGVAQVPNVFLRADCSTVPVPPIRCVTLEPSPDATFFDIKDLSSITFPPNTFNSVIYFHQTNTYGYQFLNMTGGPVPSALFRFQPYWTLESTAFNDPRAVDLDGFPLNGKLDLGAAGSRVVDRSLADGERANESLQYSRSGINGISKNFLRAFGMPEDIIRAFFRGRITIRFNMAGAARHVSNGNLSYSIRFMGD